MRRIVGRPALSLGLLSLAPCFALGCSEPEPAPDPEAAARARDQAIVADFKHDLGAIFAAADACHDDPSQDCVERTLAGLSQPTARTSSIHPNNWWTDKAAWLSSLTKQTICDQLGFVIPYARKFAGDVRIYYFYGASLQGGAGVYGTAGAEAVWELNHHEMAAFTYYGYGAGNVLGGSASAYNGVGISALGGNIIENWSGQFDSASVSIGLPGGILSAGASGFSGIPKSNARTVKGLSISISAGFDGLDPAAAVTAGSTYYRAHNTMTELLNGQGWLASIASQGPYEYRVFKNNVGIGGYNLSAGGLQALDLLFHMSISESALLAAMVAYGLDKLNASGLALAQWCDPRVAENTPSPCGGGLDTASFGIANGGGAIRPACTGGDMIPEPSPDPTPTPTTTTPGGDCSIDPDASCTGDAICSKNTREGAFCCRTPRAATTSCNSDDDCDATKNEVCAQLNNGEIPDSALFGCMKPDDACIGSTSTTPANDGGTTSQTCVAGSVEWCTGEGTTWTGTQCCLSGQHTCVDGTVEYCLGDGKLWTGAKCCD